MKTETESKSYTVVVAVPGAPVEEIRVEATDNESARRAGYERTRQRYGVELAAGACIVARLAVLPRPVVVTARQYQDGARPLVALNVFRSSDGTPEGLRFPSRSLVLLGARAVNRGPRFGIECATPSAAAAVRAWIADAARACGLDLGAGVRRRGALVSGRSIF